MANLAPEAATRKETSPFEDSSDDELAGGATPMRRSNESSPTASVYSLAGTETAVSTKPTKEYSFFNSTSHLDILIVPGAKSAKDTNPEKDAIYFVDNSMINPGKADVTVRAGSGKGGNIVGVCRMRFGFGTYNIGLGDPDHTDTEWEAMKRHGAFKTRRWEFSMPVAEGSFKRHTFTWKRTHDKSVGATHSLRNKKLIDEETKEVVAVYLTNHLKSWKKMGKLIVLRDYGEKWELMVLISLLGLIERQRRKRRTAVFAGGAAGSS